MKDLNEPNHFSYLLRLWRTKGQNFEWRASLETPETSERIGFANLEQLFTYLMDFVEGHSTPQHRTEKMETRKRN